MRKRALACITAALFLIASIFILKIALASFSKIEVHANSFTLRNLDSHDVGDLLAQLDQVSNRYNSVQGLNNYRPFFFSIDGRAYLPPSAVQAVAALPPSLVWIGDETATIIASAPQYANVVTSDGTLYGGWSKNCFFLNKLLKTQNECIYDMLSGKKFGLPYLYEILGEKKIIEFLRDEKTDAVVAGPHTYDKSKAILDQNPRLDRCFERVYDADKTLLLLRRPCAG